MNEMENIIIRINSLGLAMGVCDGQLIIQGNMRLLTPDERTAISRNKPALIAYLTAPREHVAVMCRHHQPDGRACGDIVTMQRPTGKVAWCQTCFPRQKKHEPGTTEDAVTSNGSAADKPCHCCKNTDWWISIYGQRICRVCHPPAYPELENIDGDKKEGQGIGQFTGQAYPQIEEQQGHSIVPNVGHVVLPLRGVKPVYPDESPAMYVALDLDHWVTDEPRRWAETVTICGKQYVRLSRDSVLWFKEQVSRAEDACATGKLAPEAFGRIVKAFCPVYHFAILSKLISPSPALARVLTIRKESG